MLPGVLCWSFWEMPFGACRGVKHDAFRVLGFGVLKAQGMGIRGLWAQGACLKGQGT